MDEIVKVFFRLIEMMIIFAIGLFATNAILQPIYEQFGILFIGNVWVNWFGVSYILFALYSLLVGLAFKKAHILYKHRISSTLFWVLFIGANYVVWIPFNIGENPF